MWPEPVLRGVVRAGQCTGWSVVVQQDPSRSGWHLFLTPPDGEHPEYDMWADEWADVFSYAEPERLDIEWLEMDGYTTSGGS